MELWFENANAKKLVVDFGLGTIFPFRVEADDSDDFVFCAPEDIEADRPKDFPDL